MSAARRMSPGIAAVTAIAMLAAASPAPAQQEATEQARVRAVHYASGSASHGFTLDVALAVTLEFVDDAGVRLHVMGGLPHEPAALLIGARPLAAPLPHGGTLLVDPALVLPLTLDAGGEVHLPLDLAHERFAGAAVFVQAVHLAALPSGVAYQLSPGLELRFAPPQLLEPLPWSGPDVDLLLLHDLQVTTPGSTFELLVRMRAPTEGYDLIHTRTERSANTTEVLLDLHAPDEATPVPQVITELNEHVAIGAEPGERIDVLVRQWRGGTAVSDYVLVGTLATEW